MGIVFVHRELLELGVLHNLGGVLLAKKQKMRSHILQYTPIWKSSCVECRPDRLFRILAYQNVDNVGMWLAENVVYLNIKFTSTSPIGDFRSHYYINFREFNEILDQLRRQMNCAIEIQQQADQLRYAALRNVFLRRQKEAEEKKRVNWSKDGF